MEDDQLRQELEKRRQAWLSQAEVCQSNVAKIDAALTAISTGSITQNVSLPVTTLRDMILFAIDRCGNKDFTINDIERIIIINYPDAKYTHNSLGSSFWKIAQEILTVIEPGGGRTPTLYRKK
jgi:hypothetical protein